MSLQNSEGGVAMSPTIDLDSDIFDYLKSQAEPFTDTPSSVLRRMLQLNEPADDPAAVEQQHEARARKPKASSPKRRSSAQKSKGRTRAPSGTLLPENRYEQPLLRALVEAGGQAPYRELVEAVGRELKGELMPADLENLSSGAIRWHSRLQFVRLRLIERGEMDRAAPRGIWRVSDAGRRQALNGSQS